MFRYYFLISDRSALTRDPNFAIFDQTTFCQAISARDGGGEGAGEIENEESGGGAEGEKRRRGEGEKRRRSRGGEK